MAIHSIKAVVFDKPGDPSVLHLGEAPRPVMQPNQVRIKVAAAGVNGADLMQRHGRYPPPPGASEIIGLEVAGRVMEVGSQVQDWHEGDRVMALLPGGGYAEETVVEANHCLPVPEGWSWVEAAGFMETSLTCYLNIFQIGGVKQGQTVLVHGGGSGIGTQAISLCKAKGITVFATAGSDEKCELCKQHGAAVAINYKTQDFVEVVQRETGGKGVDFVLDVVGGSYLVRNIEALALDGKLVFLSFLGGPVVKELDLTKVLLKRLSLIGSTLRSRTPEFKTRLIRAFWAEFKADAEAGSLKPAIDSTCPLETAAKAHHRLESRDHFGKAVLIVDDSL